MAYPHASVELFALDIPPDESPLAYASVWSGGTFMLKRVYNGTAKVNHLDLEYREVELKDGGTSMDTNIALATHAKISFLSGTLKLIYRVTSIEQGPVRTIPNTGTAPAYYDGVARLTLELDMLATWYYNSEGVTGASVSARWSRLPMQAVVEPFQIRPAQMKRADTQALARNIPTITGGMNGVPGTYGKILWCEVSFINSSGNFDKHGIFTMDDVIRDKAGGSPGYPVHYYPSIGQIMNDPVNYMGVPAASSIVALNISVRCPYKVRTYGGGYYIIPVLEKASDSSYMTADTVTTSDPGQGLWENIVYSKAALLQATTESMSGYITVTADQQVLGEVRLYDVCNTLIGAIDTRYAEDDNGTLKINYTLRTQSNLNGIYSRMTLSDGTEIRFPEGNTPYTGSAYQEYALAQMAYDRELLAMNQERVMVNAAVNLTGSIANGAIASIASAGLGAGTAAVGIGGNVVDAYMTYQQNERTQKAKEELMRSTPDTLYSTVNGTDYQDRWFASQIPGYAAINMPDGVSSSELSDYAKTHGYPVSDIPLTVTHPQLITAGDGFLQANMVQKFTVDMTPTPQKLIYYMNNHWFLSKLAKQLKAGVHYIVKTS